MRLRKPLSWFDTTHENANQPRGQPSFCLIDDSFVAKFRSFIAGLFHLFFCCFFFYFAHHRHITSNANPLLVSLRCINYDMKGTAWMDDIVSFFSLFDGDGTKRASNPLICMPQWQNHLNSTVKRAKSENEHFIEENDGDDKFRVERFDEE